MNEEMKQAIEKICDEFLTKYANEHDAELKDGGGFASKENFYDWKDNTFIINFLSISQDDFMDNFSLFEKMGSELKSKLEESTEVRSLFFEDDCPIAFIKF